MGSRASKEMTHPVVTCKLSEREREYTENSEILLLNGLIRLFGAFC